MEERNIGRTLSKVGPAIIASTLTTLVGWSVLLIAEHRGLHSVGVIASIGIGSSLVVALTLLPSLLAIVYSTKKEETPELSVGLNINTSFDEPVAQDSNLEEEETIDLDAANTDSSEEKLEIQVRNVSANYKEELKAKLATLKDSPIDLDNEKDEEDSIENFSKVDLNVKQDLKKKLESLRDSPLDLDEEEIEEPVLIEVPVKVDLNLKEDLKAKLKDTVKEKSASKKTSKKKAANAKLPVKVVEKKKAIIKKKPVSKKKK